MLNKVKPRPLTRALFQRKRCDKPGLRYILNDAFFEVYVLDTYRYYLE